MIPKSNVLLGVVNELLCFCRAQPRAAPPCSALCPRNKLQTDADLPRSQPANQLLTNVDSRPENPPRRRRLSLSDPQSCSLAGSTFGETLKHYFVLSIPNYFSSAEASRCLLIYHFWFNIHIIKQDALSWAANWLRSGDHYELIFLGKDLVTAEYYCQFVEWNLYSQSNGWFVYRFSQATQDNEHKKTMVKTPARMATRVDLLTPGKESTFGGRLDVNKTFVLSSAKTPGNLYWTKI